MPSDLYASATVLSGVGPAIDAVCNLDLACVAPESAGAVVPSQPRPPTMAAMPTMTSAPMAARTLSLAVASSRCIASQEP
jgi:hypothetical protein